MDNPYVDYLNDDDEYAMYSANDDDGDLAARISAQYGRGDPNEPSDAVLREIEALTNEYISQIAPLLSEAEIQLVSTKFENIEHMVESYFGKWRALVQKAEDECKNQYEMKSRVAYDLQEAREELQDYQKKMEEQERRHEAAIREYEKHQRTLETVLSQSQPKSRRVNTQEMLQQTNLSMQNLQRELDDSRDLATQQERENDRLLRENRALSKRLGISYTDPNNGDDDDSDVSGLASQSPSPQKSSVRFAAQDSGGYDADSVELKFQIEDLTSERDYLARLIQEEYDPNFIYQKEMTRTRNNTTLDTNPRRDGGSRSPRFLEDLDVSDSDLRIDPRVESQMQSMLETVRAYELGQGVFPAASQENDRWRTNSPPTKAGRNGVDSLPNDVNVLKSQLGNALNEIEELHDRIEVLDSARVFNSGFEDFADDDDTDYDESQRTLAARRKDEVMKKKKKKHERFFSTYNLLNQQPLDSPALIIQQLSSFESLIKYYEKERTYKSILFTLKGKLEISQSNCGLIQEVLGQILEEIAMSELAESSAELLTSVTQEIGVFANKITKAVEEVIDELQGASQFIHSDQKRVELLEARVRELENNIPHIGGNAKREAVMATLPNYVSEEFDTELSSERQNSFQQVLDDLNTRSDQIVTRIELVDELVNDVLLQNISPDLMDASHRGFLDNTRKEIQSTVLGVKELVEMLRTELDGCEKYMHPNQRALVRSVREKIEMEITKKSLESEMEELKGKLGALREEVLRLSQDSEQYAEADASDIRTLLKQARRMGVAGFGSEYDASESGTDDEKDGSTFVIAMSRGLNSIQQRNDLLEELCKHVGDGNKHEMKDFVNRVKRETDNIASVLVDLGDELQEKHHYVSGDALYIRKLEARYQEIRGLYKRKLKDLENMQEFMLFEKNETEKKKKRIQALERKVVRLRTSTQATTEMRMEEMNSGNRVLTYNRMIENLQNEVKRAKNSGRTVRDILQQDLPRVMEQDPDKTVAEIREEIAGNVDHIVEILEAVGDELVGARQFVHPDHDMVEVLQKQIRDLQRQIDTMDPRELRETLARQQSGRGARDSQISVSHLDNAFENSNMSERRESLMAIKQMLVSDRQRRSEVMPDDLVEAETQKRVRESDRRSTQTFGSAFNLLPSSPYGAAPSPSPQDDDDDALVMRVNVNVNEGFNRETPANSPTRFYDADGFPDVDGMGMVMQSPAVDPLNTLDDGQIEDLEMYDEAALFARRPSQHLRAADGGGNEGDLRARIQQLQNDMRVQKDAYETQIGKALHEQDADQGHEMSELRHELKKQQHESEAQQEKYWKLVKEKRDLTIHLEEKMVSIDTLELQLLEARGNVDLRMQEERMNNMQHGNEGERESGGHEKEREKEYLSHINDLIERVQELEDENSRLVDSQNESHPEEMSLLQEQLNAKVRELEEYYQNTMQSLMDVISEMQAQQEAEQLVPADFVDQITTQYEDDISKREERIEELQMALHDLEQTVSQLQSLDRVKDRSVPTSEPPVVAASGTRNVQREKAIADRYEAQLRDMRVANGRLEDRLMDAEDNCESFKRQTIELTDQVAAYSDSMTNLAKKLQDVVGVRPDDDEFDFFGDEVTAQLQERARNSERKYKREKKVWKQEFERLTLQNESLLKVQAQLTAMQLQYSNAQRNWSNLNTQQEKKISLLETQIQSLKESKFDYVQKTSEEIENLRCIIRNLRIEYEKVLARYRQSQRPWYTATATATSYGEPPEYDYAETPRARRHQPDQHHRQESPRPQYHAPPQQAHPQPQPRTAAAAAPAASAAPASREGREGVQYDQYIPDLSSARTFIRQWNPF